MANPRYYVYGVVVDQVFRYIGMGKGDRVKKLAPNNEQIQDAIAEGCDVYGLVLISDLTRTQAFEIEDKVLAACAKSLWNKRTISTSELLRKQHAGGERAGVGAKLKTILADPERNAAMLRGLAAGRTSEVHTKLWRRSSYRAARAASHERAMQRPEVRKKMQQNAMKLWNDPEARVRLLESRRQAMQRPEVREKMRQNGLKGARARGYNVEA